MSLHDWHSHAAQVRPPRVQLPPREDDSLELAARLAADLTAELAADLAALTRVLLGVAAHEVEPVTPVITLPAPPDLAPAVLVLPAAGVVPLAATTVLDLPPLLEIPNLVELTPLAPPPVEQLAAPVSSPALPEPAPLPVRRPAAVLDGLAFLDL